jgi:methyl-accepting chemotaxis protein
MADTYTAQGQWAWHERVAYVLQRAMELGGLRRQRTQFLMFFSFLFLYIAAFAVLAFVQMGEARRAEALVWDLREALVVTARGEGPPAQQVEQLLQELSANADVAERPALADGVAAARRAWQQQGGRSPELMATTADLAHEVRRVRRQAESLLSRYLVWLVAGALFFTLLMQWVGIRAFMDGMIRIRGGLLRLADLDFRRGMASRPQQDEIGDMVSCFNTLVDQQGSTVRQIRDEVRRLEEATEGVVGCGSNLRQSAAEATDLVERVNGSAQEVNRVVQEVAGDAHTVSESTGTAREHTDSGRGSVTAASQQIESLQQVSEGVVELAHTIQTIAKKTDLLALNAAIEAANAGEAGQGFAVVADEVRKLAEQTHQATVQVEERVSALRDETGSAVEQIRKVEGSFEEIADDMERTSGQADQISSAAEELAATMGETMQQMEQMTSRIRAVAGEAEQLDGLSGEMRSIASEVSGSVGRFRVED